MYSPFAHLSFWHSAATFTVDPPTRYPFAPPAGEASDEAARRLAQQLRESDPEARRELLGVLHGRSAILPWSSLHPSWLADILADASPAWRVWALSVLPTPVRAALEGDLPETEEPRLFDARPPSWWPAWFSAHVKRRLGYPDVSPWLVAAPLPSALWEKDEKELTRLLAVRGTRGFISAVRTLPRAEAQEWIWRLPSACHALADETVRKHQWSEDPFWPEVFSALAADFPQAEARLFRMALADLMRAGRQQESDLRRLAFRLPRRWGEWVLVELAARPPWLGRPVLPSVEAWRVGLDDDLDHRETAPEAGR